MKIGWSIKLGRLFGIDIKMHLTFLLVVIWGAFNYGGTAGPLYGVLVILSLFMLVFLHELGHSLAAIYYDIPVMDITLLPIGGVARLERMPEKPLPELVIALAGPLVNVLLAIILLPIVFLLAIVQSRVLSSHLFNEPGLLGLLVFLLGANISLVIFNMLPVFPMDGGRVFRALLGFFITHHTATQIAVNVGRLFALGLVIFAITSRQFWLIIIAIFIFFAGRQEEQVTSARNRLKNMLVKHILKFDNLTLSPYATISQIAPMVINSQQVNFAVLDLPNKELLGITTGGKIASAMAHGQRHNSVADIMQHPINIPTIGLTASLNEAHDKLDYDSNPVAAVYDGLNFQGLVTIDDIAYAFQFE